MSLTSTIFDHFSIWPSGVTLTFDLHKQMFWTALLLLQDYHCAKLFWNPCINVQVMARTSSIYDLLTFIWPLWPWPSTYVKNVSNGTSPPRGQQLCKIILKSMHKCTSYGPDKLNIWPLWPFFDPCDLDPQPTWKKVSYGTSPPRGKQLCKIILKSMHKCTSCAPDQLNTCILPFWPLFDPCDLDL